MKTRFDNPGVWFVAGGEMVKVEDMSTAHLMNTVKMLTTKLSRSLSMLISDIEESAFADTVWTPFGANSDDKRQSLKNVTPGELPTEFTWKYLVTTGGAAILVFFIVQYAKAPLDKVGHIPTRLLVYVLCLVTLLVANAFLNHGLQIETAALSVFNALISAYSAYGMYEVWVRKKE